MCGIAAIWSRTNQDVSPARISAMVEAMKHRGPDATGSWFVPGLGMGHKRLKILDLSDLANQPYTDGQDSLVFNGRIFNYRELRAELKQFSYRTDCDTEVLFRALQVWGEDVFKKIQGQFAFVFYDSKRKRLIAARDHAGICPLYILETEDEILFSSEMKPLLTLHKCTLSHAGIVDYFKYRYNIQNGRTLFEEIKRFPPAHCMTIDLVTSEKRQWRYWRMSFDQQRRTEADLQTDFASVMDAEIKSQQMTDVPVGLYLSGGIDSGALLAGFARASAKINAFTLSFFDGDSDSRRVDTLAKDFHFQKNLIQFTPESLEEIEDIVEALEEPFGDLIICANYFLAREASKSVRVVLSGEGGDEAFCGYDHQRAFLKLHNYNSNPLLARAMKLALAIIPPGVLGMLQSYPGRFGKDELNRVRDVLGKMSSPGSAYSELVSLFSERDLQGLFSETFKKSGSIEPDAAPLMEIFEHDGDFWQAVLRSEIEQMTLIVNLLKQERFGMHYSMEGCVPFVSRPVLEFVSTIPFENIFSRINKKLLLDYSKQSVIKKKPFSLFETDAYHEKLTELFDRYTSDADVADSGVLNPEYLASIRKNLKSGSMLNIKRAMAVLIFMVWMKRFRKYMK